MDGFRIDTGALEQAASQINDAAQGLANTLWRLREARSRLDGQRGCCDREIQQLAEAIRRLEEHLAEIRELSRQAYEVGQAYQLAEDRVAQMVASLPAASPFAQGAQAVGRGTPIQVGTTYHPGGPMPVAGNALPCEDWLLARMWSAKSAG